MKKVDLINDLGISSSTIAKMTKGEKVSMNILDVYKRQIKYSEPTLRLDAKDEEGFQDVNLMLFHKVIAFDNYRQKLILILNIKTDDLEINYHRACLLYTSRCV